MRDLPDTGGTNCEKIPIPLRDDVLITGTFYRKVEAVPCDEAGRAGMQNPAQRISLEEERPAYAVSELPKGPKAS